jgi:hypothetical protein
MEAPFLELTSAHMIGDIPMTAKAKKIEETLEAVCNPTACAKLTLDGAEGAVAISKICLNLAAKQNAEILASIKKAVKGTPLAELPVFDLAAEAVESYIAIQNDLLDLGLDQVNAVINAILATGTDTDKAKVEFANVLRSSVERGTTAQNSLFEYAVERTKAGMDAVKTQRGIAGTEAEAMAERISNGFDTVVAAQKEILGMAAKQMKSAAAAV